MSEAPRPVRIEDPAAFGRVAVLMGGWSAEREVSLRSGAAVLAALRERGVDAEAVDLDRRGLARLPGEGYARAFNVVHGRGGEDGLLQAALELAGLPCTGTGVLGSALAMDKGRAKLCWRGGGLPTPDFRMLASVRDCEAALDALGLPVVVKPVLEGSSIGMAKVEAPAELEPAWREARRYGPVMAERWVHGAEYTAAIVAGEALPLIRLETPRKFYDYAAKYQADDTRYHCPAGLSQRVEADYQALCLKAFELLDGRGWGRVDFLVDRTGQPFLIELNTVPGMTDHSLVPMAARQAGMDLPALVWRILETTLGEGGT